MLILVPVWKGYQSWEIVKFLKFGGFVKEGIAAAREMTVFVIMMDNCSGRDIVGTGGNMGQKKSTDDNHGGRAEGSREKQL